MFQKWIYALATVAVVSFAGCKEDLSQATAQWDTMLKDYKTQTEKVKKEYADVMTTWDALPKVPADTAAGKAATEFEATINAAKQQLSGIDPALDSAKRGVTDAMTQGKLAGLNDAIVKAKNDLSGVLSRTSISVAGLTTKIAELKPIVEGQAASDKKKADDIAAFTKKLDEVTHQGGTIDFAAIEFKPGTAELVRTSKDSEAQLQQIIAIAKACKEMKFTVTSHLSSEGDAKANQKLTEQRAATVKDFVVQAGVDAKVISKSIGAGSSKPLVKEPAADSEEAKKMDEKALEELRAPNRRISVEVATPCKVAKSN